MAENNEGAVKVKKSFWKGIKSEFKKIIWPSKNDLFKQSSAVVVITIVLGLIISLLDKAIQLGIDKIF